MAHIAYHPPSPLTMASTVAKRWGPSLGIWGVGAGAAALFLLSVTPVVRNGLLVRVPVIGSYYEDKTPPSDKPF